MLKVICKYAVCASSGNVVDLALEVQLRINEWMFLMDHVQKCGWLFGQVLLLYACEIRRLIGSNAVEFMPADSWLGEH